MKGHEPGVAEVFVVSVSVEEVPLAGFGLKALVTPEPRPLTDSATDPVNPPVLVILVV